MEQNIIKVILNNIIPRISGWLLGLFKISDIFQWLVLTEVIFLGFENDQSAKAGEVENEISKDKPKEEALNKREKREGAQVEEYEEYDDYSDLEDYEEIYEYDYAENGKPTAEQEETIEKHLNNKRKCEVYLR